MCLKKQIFTLQQCLTVKVGQTENLTDFDMRVRDLANQSHNNGLAKVNFWEKLTGLLSTAPRDLS